MTCEHLQKLEQELIEKGIPELFRGQAWTDNCREWVYFDCYLNNDKIRERIDFEKCVIDHEHFGTHDGKESGFYCAECHDGVIGVHPTLSDGKPEIV